MVTGIGTTAAQLLYNVYRFNCELYIGAVSSWPGSNVAISPGIAVTKLWGSN